MSAQHPSATRRGLRIDWVKFDAALARNGDIDPVDKALYAAIASFVDTGTRESPRTDDVDPNVIPSDVPTRKRLAECIGRSVDTVDRSSKRLEALGILRVHRKPDPQNPKRHIPSEYELLDHEQWDERAAERAAHRRAGGDQGGSRTGAATPGRTDAATPGRTGAAVKEEEEKQEERKNEPADGRRPSAGGRGDTGSSGSAASSKKSPTPKTRKVPPQRPVPGEADVYAALKVTGAARRKDGTPADLDRIPTLRRAVRDLLRAGRTPEHAAARIDRGWWQQQAAERSAPGYRGCSRCTPTGCSVGRPECDRINRPVGYLVSLLSDRECEQPHCEAGILLDTGRDCSACDRRAEDRRAQKACDDLRAKLGAA